MKKKNVIIAILLLCVYVASIILTWGIFREKEIETKVIYLDYEKEYRGKYKYSIDEIYPDAVLSYEITPEMAVEIAKIVLKNLYDESYVKKLAFSVVENAQSQSALEKYGEIYDIFASEYYSDGTSGEYVAISKVDGRILKV